MKALVCEDDRTVARMFESFLKATGECHVDVAHDGVQSKERIDASNYDVIIMDLHMPYEKGDVLLRYLRTDKRSSVPVIVVSGDDDEMVAEMIVGEGADCFLPKPVTAQQFSGALRRIGLSS